MAYVPNSGSVVSFQPPGSLLTVIQKAGSVLAVSGSFTPTGNQSVSGTVQAELLSTNASVITVGSPVANQSVSGAITAPPGSVTQVRTDNASVITVPQFSSILAVPVGSVITVLQSSSIIARVTGSVATLGIAGSITTVVNPAGSITTVRISDLIQEETVGGPSIRGIPLVWESNANTSVMSTVSPTNPLRVLGSISGAVTAPAGSIMQVSGATTTTAGSIISTANPAGSVTQVRTDNASVISIFQNSSIIAINAGSVITINPGSIITVFQAPSIVGTYAEDAAHTSADKGIFVLGVRNDAVASFMSANLEYGPMATDSAGRTIVKPFAPGESSQIGISSTVNWGTTNAASIRLFLAPGAGLKNYVTDILVANTGAATTLVNIVDEDASVIGKTIAPAGGGSNHSFTTPLVTQIANKAVGVIATTATSVLHVTLGGYKAP